MISTDFAPNESWDDAWQSIKLLFMPWLWQKGDGIDKVRKWFHSKYLVSSIKYQVYFFLSGRSALYYLLKSLNLPKGSGVIVQAFTCEAVVLPIIELGLKPVYIDIESQTFSMDFNSIASLPREASAKWGKQKVLILQHTFGLTPKYRKEILELAKKNNWVIIEDLAHGFNHAIFQTDNRQLTTDHYFLLSFGRSKMLSSVFGGVIISHGTSLQRPLQTRTSPSYFFIFRCLLYKPLTMLIKSTYDIYLGKILHKMLIKLELIIPEITKKEKNGSYDQIFNKAYPNALAILLNHQLKKYEQVNKQRAKICAYFNSVFASVILNGAKRSEGSSETLSNILDYANGGFFTSFRMTKTGLIRFPLLVKNREVIVNKMKEKNIYLGKWYDQVVGPNYIDLKRVEYKSGSCPNAEEICKKIINLPTNITEQEAERIVEELGLSERSESKA